MKITYEGMKATRKYLNVYARQEHNGAVRFIEVKIPLAALDTGQVAEAMDQKVRLDLLSIWSQERDDVPLW